MILLLLTILLDSLPPKSYYGERAIPTIGIIKSPVVFIDKVLEPGGLDGIPIGKTFVMYKELLGEREVYYLTSKKEKK
jgi:hypothetical protein